MKHAVLPFETPSKDKAAAIDRRSIHQQALDPDIVREKPKSGLKSERILNILENKENTLTEKRKLDRLDEPIELYSNLKKVIDGPRSRTPINIPHLSIQRSLDGEQSLDINEASNDLRSGITLMSEEMKAFSSKLKTLRNKPSKDRNPKFENDRYSREILDQAREVSKQCRTTMGREHSFANYEDFGSDAKWDGMVYKSEKVDTDPLKRYNDQFRASSRAFDEELKKEQSVEKELLSLKKEHEENQERLREEQKAKELLESRLLDMEKEREMMRLKFDYEKERIIHENEKLNELLMNQEKSKMKQLQSIDKLKREIQESDETLAALRRELDKSNASRMVTLTQLQELRGNLRIFCRVRPVESELERVIFLRDKEHRELIFQGDPSKRTKPIPYTFDNVFGEKSTQDEVFNAVEPFIQSVVDGKRVSIFAYGPTGSGKTHTLEGVNSNSESLSESSGVMPRSLAFIIDWICKNNLLGTPEDHLEVYVSCLEIYNERLKDLLGPEKVEDEIQIQVHKGKVVLQDVVKKKIESVADALETIRLSSKRRQTEATSWNENSSRSHSIYRISIVKKTDGAEVGLLNIIDMAGSEKNSNEIGGKGPAPAQSKSFRTSIPHDKIQKIQKEANFINKSLTTLGRIIRLIKQQRSMGVKDLCIPYRESKLTRMLQDCIGGEAQTLMIVNINPSAKCASQTKETLNFSSIACV